ncbi:MAG: hypothetical protein L3K06_06830 [Thermoplasmata archaeon]|nr:hypothetical protein [Thermoplasmata archaeon]MCI4355061.1 hypothetical protein [Thermoplasmata archaeon]
MRGPGPYRTVMTHPTLRGTMAEGEPVDRTGGTGGVLVPEIGPGTPRPARATAIPPTLVLGYLDLAIRGVLEYERYHQVYVSPWWSVEDVPQETSVWKRAVLERVPLRGALHWGHLYLVVAPAASSPSRLRLFRGAAIGPAVAERPDEQRLSLREGAQLAELVVHPTKPDRAERLVAFGREVEVRFRRQMD